MEARGSVLFCVRQFCCQELRDDVDVVLEAVRQDVLSVTTCTQTSPEKPNARATMSPKMSKDVQRLLS